MIAKKARKFRVVFNRLTAKPIPKDSSTDLSVCVQKKITELEKTLAAV